MTIETKREDLSTEEKLQCWESSIDRSMYKVNRNSDFNQFLSDVQTFGDEFVVSAELYTREQAGRLFKHACGKDTDIRFGFVKMGYCEEYGRRVRQLQCDIDIDKVNNLYKPVFYMY